MDYLKSAVNFILGIDDADEPQRVNMKDDDDETGLTEDAISEVQSASVCSRAVAVRTLKKHNGNVQKAIAELKK